MIRDLVPDGFPELSSFASLMKLKFWEVIPDPVTNQVHPDTLQHISKRNTDCVSNKHFKGRKGTVTTAEAREIGFCVGANVVAVNDIVESGYLIVQRGSVGIITEIDEDDHRLPVSVFWPDRDEGWWVHWDVLSLLTTPEDNAEDELVVYDIDQLLFGTEY